MSMPLPSYGLAHLKFTRFNSKQQVKMIPSHPATFKSPLVTTGWMASLEWCDQEKPPAQIQQAAQVDATDSPVRPNKH